MKKKESEIRKERQIKEILAKKICKLMEQENIAFSKLQEIRIRSEKPLIIYCGDKEQILPSKETEKYIVHQEEIEETMAYISQYSLYAYEMELSQGFITIEGGHRVGIAGKVMLEEGKIKNMQYISSLNIRMAHEIKGCSDKILQFLIQKGQICHTLIISPPGCGKTTLLRDIIRQVSDGNEYIQGCSVGVVDERSELGGCYRGVAQNDLGMRTDILDCCPKSEGMLMLVRTMAPQVIAVDEIGTAEEIHAIEYAMQCGCKMIVSVHGKDMEEARAKPILGNLIRNKRFERYVVLKNENHPGEIAAIYGERGNLLCSGL